MTAITIADLVNSLLVAGRRHHPCEMRRDRSRRRDPDVAAQPGDMRECPPQCAQTKRLGRYTAFAISRSLNFWILPVEVFGISANTKWRGHL